MVAMTCIVLDTSGSYRISIGPYQYDWLLPAYLHILIGLRFKNCFVSVHIFCTYEGIPTQELSLFSSTVLWLKSISVIKFQQQVFYLKCWKLVFKLWVLLDLGLPSSI